MWARLSVRQAAPSGKEKGETDKRSSQRKTPHVAVLVLTAWLPDGIFKYQKRQKVVFEKVFGIQKFGLAFWYNSGI